jgi:hypothetical protein
MNLSSSFKVEVLSARLAFNVATIIECHIIFRGVCRSSKEIPCHQSSDIEINFTTNFLMSDYAVEEGEDDDYHAVVYITSRQGSSRSLMSRAFLDLRLSHLYNGDFISVETFHCFDHTDGLEPGSAGVLFVRLCAEDNISVDKIEEIRKQIDKFQNQINSEMHEVFQSMRILWAKARKDFPFIENKSAVKLIAEDECGQNRVCCDFVRPIFPPREFSLANGPRFSARFVSLIPFNRSLSMLGDP